MAKKKPITVQYRRAREQKTNYKKRLRLLLSGKARLTVRFTNTKVIAQIIEFTPKGDKVLVGMDSSALKGKGWSASFKNTSAAYLFGLLFGSAAVKAGVEQVILDTGRKAVLHQGKVFAFLKGVLDAGLDVPHGGEDVFPSEERIQGQYLKNNMADQFEKVKASIQNG